MFGSPETTTGGRALKFYSSVRLDIRKIATIKDADVVKGARTRVKVVKNNPLPWASIEAYPEWVANRVLDYRNAPEAEQARLQREMAEKMSKMPLGFQPYPVPAMYAQAPLQQ